MFIDIGNTNTKIFNDADISAMDKLDEVWVTTANGKKEISRVIEPYDMTPGEIANWISRKKAEGYVNEERENGKWRDVYVKYEETYEGYCLHANKKDIDGTDK